MSGKTSIRITVLFLLLLILFSSLFGVLRLSGQSNNANATRKKILVIVPHEDDEAILAAGVIRSAVINGDDVQVAVVTNGDYTAQDYNFGEMRLQETISAMELLGLSKKNITAFGYSDTGGLEMEPWTRYVDSFLYRLYHAEDPDMVIASNFGNTKTYGIPKKLNDYHYTRTRRHGDYTRNTFVEDLTTFISDYMPDSIYTTSAYDRHGDHAYLNVFVTEILCNLVRETPGYQPVMYESIVHAAEDDALWPEVGTDPAPLQNFTPPANLSDTPFRWEDRISIPVPEDMQTLPRSTNLKNACLETYSSQYDAYIGSFVKAEEIFWKKDFSNLAFHAEISASSEIPGYSASSVADGSIGGYLQLPESSWIPAEEATGSWVQMNWKSGQSVSQIILHSRPNTSGHITCGTLLFSDGTSLEVKDIPAGGQSFAVNVNSENITWIRFTITESVGTDVGLAEIEVF